MKAEPQQLERAWRNGRRGRLKICCPQGRGSSSLPARTRDINKLVRVRRYRARVGNHRATKKVEFRDCRNRHSDPGATIRGPPHSPSREPARPPRSAPAPPVGTLTWRGCGHSAPSARKNLSQLGCWASPWSKVSLREAGNFPITLPREFRSQVLDFPGRIPGANWPVQRE
jgi:hypothetical protein